MVTTINATDLNATDPMKVVTPAPDAIIGSGTGIINSSVNQTVANQTASDKAVKDQQARIDQYIADQAKLSTKAGDTASALESSGYNAEKAKLDEQNMKLNDINASVSGLANEAKAIPLQIQDKFGNTGATDAGVAPIQAGELRKNAIKALTQASLSDIITANINNSQIRMNSAKDKAQQIVDLKYQPIEDEIKNLKDQIELNKTYVVDPAEKKLLDGQKTILDERARLIAEKKTTDKDFTDTITSGINNGSIDATKGYSVLGDYNAGNLSIADAYKKLNLKNVTDPAVAQKTLAGAISKVESAGSGDYSAVGKKITSGQNAGYSALGKYQIMPNLWFSAINLDPTKKEDQDKFLNSPDLQDTLFNYIIGTLDKKYSGNQDKVIASYFGGDAGAQAVGTPAGDKITDGNTSINQYVAKVKANLQNANPSTAQYGLLANTSFDLNNDTDKNAQQYLSNYIKNATLPTAISLGLGRSSKPLQQKEFQAIQQRAGDLYFEATGQSLPDVQILKANKALIAKNNQILNNNQIASDTVQKNFDLAIKGEISNNVNKNATIVNRLLNPIYLALGDPAVNQALVSNGTITQEFANLISIRNAQGTTVADKEMANELIRFGTTVEAQKAVVERLKQEAVNIHSALENQNGDLWKQIDPLAQDANNPNRKALLEKGSEISNGVDLNKFFKTNQ